MDWAIISLVVIVATPTLITADCQQGKFLVHPESSEKFLLCIFGVFYELTCPFGLHFNSTINECAENNCIINSATINDYSDCSKTTPNNFADRFPISMLATGSASSYMSTMGSPADQIAAIVNPHESTTSFNAGNNPPQWIQLKLPMAYTVHSIHLKTIQVPAGKTVHKLYVGATSNPTELVNTLDGYTVNDQWFNLTYSPPLTNVRYLLLRTVSSPSWVSWAKFLIY